MPRPILRAGEQDAIWRDEQGAPHIGPVRHDDEHNFYHEEDFRGPHPPPPPVVVHPDGRRQDFESWVRGVHEGKVDLHQMWDKAQEMGNRALEREEERMSAPFKAITNYDEYVEPTIHHWDPSTANDPDDDADYEDQVQDFNRDGWTPEERARTKRHHELVDMSREFTDSMGHMFLHGDHHDADAQYRADVLRKLYDNAVHHNDPGVTAGETLADEDLPHSGTMVSLPGHEQSGPSMPSSADLKGFMEHNRDVLKDNLYGGWEWPASPDREEQQRWNADPRYFHDVSHNFVDPWEGAMAGVSGDQREVRDLDGMYSPEGAPSNVKTPAYLNDQIAKGGRRVIPWTDEVSGGRVGSTGSEVAQPRQSQGQRGASQGASDSRAQDPYAGRWGPAARDRTALRPRTPSRLVTAADLAQAPVPVAPQAPQPVTFDPTGMQQAGQAGGHHGAMTYRNPSTGAEWIVKRPPEGQEYLANLDVAANHIAKLSGVDTPDTTLIDASQLPGLGSGPASAQVKIPSSAAFPEGFNPEAISDDDLLTIQKHHALDWALSNHDSHPGGFIRTPEGKLIGIDKGQAFKYFGQDKLHWKFHPNSGYGETEPVYNTLYRNFAKGGRAILDPRQGELAHYIQGLQNIPDKDYADTLRPYAEAAAKSGFLSHPWSQPGLVKPTVAPNDVDAFLAAAVARKHNLANDFGKLYDKAAAYRSTGTKIALTMDPTLIPSMNNDELEYLHQISWPWSQGGQVAGDLHDLVEHEIKHRQRINSKVASYYNVHLKLHDGTPDESYDADIYHDARGKADELARKHGLEIREKSRSPNDVGAGSTYLPAYRGGQWVGNIAIEKPGDLSESPLGPHASQYSYARVAAKPDPSQMTSLHQELGSHSSQLWSDPQGQWLLKRPNRGNEFLIPLDVATTALQQRMGLPAAETHTIPAPNQKFLVNAVKMWPGAYQAWKHPPSLTKMDPADLLTVQKHQALDWLISNHDAHVGNWMYAPGQGLVAVDKGQALKYFGQDKLDWNFHPNYYAREPIYNNLYREFAAGAPGQPLNDPREGELGSFVGQLQGLPDDELKSMFRPYAYAAAHAGMLGTGKYGGQGPADPNRGLTEPTVAPNDPEAFLDAMVHRKHNLGADLGDLYDRAATHRASALLGGQPYQPPEPPPAPSYAKPPVKPYAKPVLKSPAPERLFEDDEDDDPGYQGFLHNYHQPAQPPAPHPGKHEWPDPHGKHEGW